MSTSQVTYPIVAALVKAEAALGSNRQWVSQNAEQEAFLREVFDEVRSEVDQGIRSLESSYSLNGQNLTIKGVLDLLVKWVRKGDKVTITRDGEKWKGVRLTAKGAEVEFLSSDANPHPLVAVPTQSDDVLYMTVLDNAPDPLKLRSVASSILEQQSWSRREYGAVQFPMVDLCHQNQVDWLEGLSTNARFNGQDVPTWLAEAWQETKLRMNEVGAHVRSEFIGRMVIGAAMTHELPDYVINKPFLLVFTRPSLKQPLAVLYITEEDWKNPGTLDF